MLFHYGIPVTTFRLHHQTLKITHGNIFLIPIATNNDSFKRLEVVGPIGKTIVGGQMKEEALCQTHYARSTMPDALCQHYARSTMPEALCQTHYARRTMPDALSGQSDVVFRRHLVNTFT
ncbi:hypothetical protein EVAR_100513_1 [Eumeta japonica]|uniref:Uncharacterized protein n=1 Tax=Eumeta variegata TaxID=151549 RepID=A0A4C2AB90_EUMVA|nr:hypothetical protein EVAR_100513_1 [Eumeta japonica]